MGKAKRTKKTPTQAAPGDKPKRSRGTMADWAASVGIEGWRLLPAATRKLCAQARTAMKAGARASATIDRARRKIEELEKSAVFTRATDAYALLLRVREDAKALVEALRRLAPPKAEAAPEKPGEPAPVANDIGPTSPTYDGDAPSAPPRPSGHMEIDAAVAGSV